MMKKSLPILSQLLFCLLLLGLPLFMDTKISSTFGVSKTTLLSAISLLIASLWIVRLTYFRERFARTPIDLFILAYLATSLLSTILGRSPLLSFFGSYERQEGLITLINYIFLFYATVNLLEKEAISRIIHAVVLAGVLSSGLGITQHYEMNILNLQWGSFSKDRVVSTFGNSVFFGAYTIMTLPLALTLFTLTKKSWLVFVYGLSFLIILLGFIFANVRACYVGLFFEVVFAVIISLFFLRKNLPIKRLAILALFALLTLSWYNLRGGGTSVIKRFAEVSGKKTEEGHRFEGSFGARLMMWKTGIAMVKHNPIFGVGPEAIGITYPYYLYQTYTRDFPFEYEDRMHNEIFDVSVTRGLLGFFAYYGMVFAFFFFSIKRIIKAGFPERVLLLGISVSCLGYLIQNLASFGLSSFSSLFWVLMGLSFLYIKPKAKVIPAKRYYFLLLLIPIAILGFLVRNTYSADIAFRKAEYENAIKLNPFCRDYRESYGIYLVEMGKNQGVPWPDKIIEEMNKACQLFKNDGILLSILGMGYEMKGEIDKALPIYEKSVRINPYMGNTYNNLGAIYANRGMYKEAADAFLRGLKGFPEDGRLFNNAKQLGSILLDTGKEKEAEGVFDKMEKLCLDKNMVLTLHRELSQRYWTNGGKDGFVKHTKKIISLDEKNFEAYRNLGSFYFMERNKSALFYLNKAQELRPSDEMKAM
ncbi:O-antigen ligase family protein, partial [bacterium]|nr:O-antigen ligase family protein [bacterium]